jgi:hypothetical protein
MRRGERWVGGGWFELASVGGEFCFGGVLGGVWFHIVEGETIEEVGHGLWLCSAAFAGDGFFEVAVGCAVALFLWVFVEKVVGFFGDVIFDAVDDLVGDLAVGRALRMASLMPSMRSFTSSLLKRSALVGVKA